MLDKSHGAVGCGHCKGLGATQTCEKCGLVVCAACLSAGNCSVPQPVELRLGMGARLREVDPSGRVGVVSRWPGGTRLVELASGEAIEDLSWWRRSTKVDTFTMGGHWPVLLGTDLLMWVSGAEFRVPRLMTKDVGAKVQLEHRIDGWKGPREACLVQVTADGSRGVVVRADHKLDVLDLEQMRLLGVLGERRQIIQSCAASSAMGLIAVGGFRKAAFYKLRDVERMGSRTVGEGEVDWIGLGGSRAVMISDDGHMEVAEVDQTRPPHLWKRQREVNLASNITPLADLSPDGALLALRMWRKAVEVFNLSTGDRQTLRAHTDDVVLVRFVDEGRRLITADEDNRAMLWPRMGDWIVEE